MEHFGVVLASVFSSWLLERRTSTASVSKPTRLKSSINPQIAMFKAVYRGEADDSAFSR